MATTRQPSRSALLLSRTDVVNCMHHGAAATSKQAGAPPRPGMSGSACGSGQIRTAGRMIRGIHLFSAEAPAKSRGAWDRGDLPGAVP